MSALANTSTEAVGELAMAAEQVLRYIDSAHGDDFRALIEECVIPGSTAIERLRAAISTVRGAA